MEMCSIEDVQVVIGRDPDSTRAVFVKSEDEGLSNTFRRTEVLELCTVIAEEPVLGGDPEKSCVIFCQIKDIQVAKTFVLTVSGKAELLRQSAAEAGEDKRHSNDDAQQARSAWRRKSRKPEVRFAFRQPAQRESPAQHLGFQPNLIEGIRLRGGFLQALVSP
jgi:hypothetical protein